MHIAKISVAHHPERGYLVRLDANGQVVAAEFDYFPGKIDMEALSAGFREPTELPSGDMRFTITEVEGPADLYCWDQLMGRDG